MKPKIEPFIIPQEKQDQVKAVLENPKLPELHKKLMMRNVGACLVCRKMATKIVKYRMFGMIKIEKYCDECLERMKI